MNSTETQPERPSKVSSTPTLHLLFLGGTGVVKRGSYVLSSKSVAIGRHVKSEHGVGLATDRRASRLHAIVELQSGGAIHILDKGSKDGKGSKNGLFVNGRRVDKAILRDGDMLRMGDSFLLLRYKSPETTADEIEGLVGWAPAMNALRKDILSASPTATTLLQGESGTGKEVVAHALHSISNRAGKFIAFNCAAVPEHLFESQLFGQRAGAFTDARDGAGLFRAADKGTLFLDEVGELPLSVQPKLLRMLEERAVIPLGMVEPIHCDVRLIAATNRDLEKAVAAGHFRGDLYARLAVVKLNLPPLRERREDVLALLLHALGKKSLRLSPDLVHALLLHPWPYNVREVLSIAEVLRPLVGSKSNPELDLSLVEGKLAPIEAKTAIPATREETEAMLADCHGNKSELARKTGRSRRQIDRWLGKPEHIEPGGRS